MAIDRNKLKRLFQELGAHLATPTTLCLFGSSPGILRGQQSRQTQDVDVWEPKSSFDNGELERACEKIGVLYDPQDEVDPDSVYLQIVSPGIVALPSDFQTEPLASYGNLHLVMPIPAVIAAAKLVRAYDRDIADIAWWIKQSNIDSRQIETAISQLPQPAQRENAKENMVIVQLVTGK